MSAALHGFLIGLSFVIFIGPVFFYLLKSTLENGFWSGLAVALGIVIGDLICIIICSLGAIPFFNNPNNQFWLGIIGCSILLGLGTKFIIKPEAKTERKLKKKINTGANLAGQFIQGFLINFVNPFVFVVWIGIIGYARAEYTNANDVVIFLATALVGIFATDVTKVYFAQKIKRFLTPLFIKRLFRIFGVILIVFGFRIIFYLFK